MLWVCIVCGFWDAVLSRLLVMFVWIYFGGHVKFYGAC